MCGKKKKKLKFFCFLKRAIMSQHEPSTAKKKKNYRTLLYKIFMKAQIFQENL